MKFGEKLIKLRKEKNLTQQEAADAAGISRRTYISYEQEGRYPRKRLVYEKLADLFGCDRNYLLTEDEEFISAAAEQYGPKGKRQAEQLVEELTGMFAGGELSERDMDAVMIALQKAYFECKQDNRKYAPKSSADRVSEVKSVD